MSGPERCEWIDVDGEPALVRLAGEPSEAATEAIREVIRAARQLIDTRGARPATWRVENMHGGSGTISHGVIAVAPGCPAARHPTRDCACKVFPSRARADAYVAEQQARASAPDSGPRDSAA